MHALISQKPTLYVLSVEVEKACFIVSHASKIYIIKQMKKPKPCITL